MNSFGSGRATVALSRNTERGLCGYFSSACFARSMRVKLRSYDIGSLCGGRVLIWRIDVRAIHRIRLGAQVRQHVMAAARGALVAQRGDVDRRDDDPFAGAGRGFGEHAAVEVDHLTAAGPRVRRIVFQARALIRRDDVSDVLERAAAIDDRPPVHRLGRAPRIHVSRDANQALPRRSPPAGGSLPGNSQS